MNTSLDTTPVSNANISQIIHYQFFYEDMTIMLLYFLTVCTSFFANSIVCYVCFALRPSSKAHLLIGNMAASDLIFGAAILLQWGFCSSTILNQTEYICATLKTFQIVCLFVSSNTMALISYDR